MSKFSEYELQTLQKICDDSEFIEDAELILNIVEDALSKEEILAPKINKEKVKNQLRQFSKAFNNLSIDAKYWIYQNLQFSRNNYDYLFTDLKNVFERPYGRVQGSEARKFLEISTLLTFVKFELKIDSSLDGPLITFLETISEHCSMPEPHVLAKEITKRYRKRES